MKNSSVKILSKLVKIKANLPVDNLFIEAELKKLKIVPLRWAIVKVENEELTISVACESLC